MSDRNHDDLADALGRLSSGEHHEHDEQHDAEHGDDHVHEHVEPPAPAAPPPQRRKPSAPNPVAPPARKAASSQQGVRPAAPRPAGGSGGASPAPPRAPRPAAPADGAASRPQRPASPAQPAQPTASRRPAAPPAQAPSTPPPSRPRPAAPSGARPAARAASPGTPSRSARPAAPGQPAAKAPPTEEFVVDGGHGDDGAEGYADEQTTGVEAIDEDDAVIVPAAPISTLGYGMEHYAQQAAHKRKLDFRQTTIPILLTVGALLLFIPLLRFFVDPDAALAAVLKPIWLSIVLALIGAAMIGSGIFTMFQVKNMLEADAADPK